MKGSIAVFSLFIAVVIATMEAVKAADLAAAAEAAAAESAAAEAAAAQVQTGQSGRLFPPWSTPDSAYFPPVFFSDPEEFSEFQTESQKNIFHSYIFKTYFQISEYHKTHQFQAEYQKSAEFQTEYQKSTEKIQSHRSRFLVRPHEFADAGPLAEVLAERQRQNAAAELEQVELEQLTSLAVLFTKKLFTTQEEVEQAQEAEEDMRSQNVQERGTAGSLWIAAGLSSLATFCVAAIALILLNLKGQRKVGQKEVSLVNNNSLGNVDTR